MSKFPCRCGNVISDSLYPCDLTGELKWQNETESQSQDRNADIKDFLVSIENGEGERWIKDYFDEGYPQDRATSDIIEDITSRVEGRSGRCVYRCPDCERIYVQKEFYSDERTCYEKAE